MPRACHEQTIMEGIDATEDVPGRMHLVIKAQPKNYEILKS